MTATIAPAARTKPARPLNFRPHKRFAMVVGVIAAAAVLWVIFNGPQLDLLFAASPVIQIHVAAAISAFTLGGVLILARKGNRLHRTAGWVWVGIMGVVALASLFITGLNGTWWSWIHVLSGTTLLMLPLGVRAARKRNLTAHRSIMVSLYLGGMLIAGGFTFIPGRLMYDVFIGR